MDSAGSFLMGCGGTCFAHTGSSTDVASCRIVPANCCPKTTPIVRLAGLGKQRSFSLRGRGFSRICDVTNNGALSWNSAGASPEAAVGNHRSRLQALVNFEKDIPEEQIEEPSGVPAQSLPIGNKPICGHCEAKGAVRCLTCTGSGLYVDSILESQGIIVKVKCLGCGGTGSIMCPHCGGRGHSENCGSSEATTTPGVPAAELGPL